MTPNLMSGRNSEEAKDVFIFSPIFETVEEAVQVRVYIQDSFTIRKLGIWHGYHQQCWGSK